MPPPLLAVPSISPLAPRRLLARQLCAPPGGRGKGIDINALLGAADPGSDEPADGRKAGGGRGRGLPHTKTASNGDRFSDAPERQSSASRGRFLGFRTNIDVADVPGLDVVQLPPRGGGKPLQRTAQQRLPVERIGGGSSSTPASKSVGRGQDVKGAHARMRVHVADDPLSEELMTRYATDEPEVHLGSKAEKAGRARGRAYGHGAARRAHELEGDEGAEEGRRRRSKGRGELEVEADFDEGAEEAEEEEEDSAGRMVADVRKLYAHVVETSHVLPMRTQKLKGLAKAIAADSGEEQPMYDIPVGYMGFKRSDFEPYGSQAPVGQYRPSAIDSMLSHREDNPQLFAPAPRPLSSVDEWFAAVGASEASPLRQNVRLSRVFEELSEHKYTDGQRQQVARAMRKMLRDAAAAGADARAGA